MAGGFSLHELVMACGMTEVFVTHTDEGGGLVRGGLPLPNPVANDNRTFVTLTMTMAVVVEVQKDGTINTETSSSLSSLLHGTRKNTQIQADRQTRAYDHQGLQAGENWQIAVE